MVPIRVFLVDDSAEFLDSAERFLATDPQIEVVGRALSGPEALKRVAELHPDLVLMDLVMDQMDGAAATRAIRQNHPHVQVIALTSFREEMLVQKALQAGAISYLLKNVSADELAAAIRAAHVGRSTLAPEAAEALIHAAAQPPAPGFDLTARERDVLELMIKGLSNVEIAERLVVSQSTIKTHVSSILAKLGVTSRTEAVALAIQHHLLN